MGLFSKIYDSTAYFRRRGKVAAALATLPKNNEVGQKLKGILAEADAIARKNDYKTAYKMLNTPKAEARTEEKKRGEKIVQKGSAESEIGNAIIGKIDQLQGRIDGAVQEYFKTMEIARTAVAKTDDYKKKPAQVVFFACKDKLTNARKLIVQSISVYQELNSIYQLILASIKKHSKKIPKDTQGRIEKKLRSISSNLDIFNPAKSEYDKIGTLLETLPEPVPAEDRFAEIEERDKERLEKERERMREDRKKDDTSLAPGQSSKIIKKELKKANLEGDLKSKAVDITSSESWKSLKTKTTLDAAEKERLFKDVRKQIMAAINIDTLVQDLTKPDSDEAFDLLTLSKKDMSTRISGMLGIKLEFSGPKVNGIMNELFQEIAEKIQKKIQEKSTNKFSGKKTVDGKERRVVVLNGIEYTETSVLGKGGFGEVTRFEADGHPPIAIKIPLNSSKEDEAGKEARMHRLAMGEGESKNVVGLKGVLRTENGGLAMVMECCDGGDLETVGSSMRDACKSGVIRQDTKNILVRHMMKQAVKGMEQVRSMNLVHQDMKELNVFLSEDGTVKIADFGSTESIGEDGTVKFGSGTGPYKPKDGTISLSQNKRGEKVDVFAMGVMLQRLSSDDGAPPKTGGSPYDPYSLQKPVERKKRKPDPKWRKGDIQMMETEGDGSAVTAFDRLRNSMVSENPEDRPTMEAITQSAFFDETDETYSPEDIQTLSKAMIAYGKALKKYEKDKSDPSKKSLDDSITALREAERKLRAGETAPAPTKAESRSKFKAGLKSAKPEKEKPEDKKVYIEKLMDEAREYKKHISAKIKELKQPGASKTELANWNSLLTKTEEWLKYLGGSLIKGEGDLPADFETRARETRHLLYKVDLKPKSDPK